MKNHKNQDSYEKRSKSKKKELAPKSNRKITEFFCNYMNGINTNNIDIINHNYKNENEINLKEEIEQDEKFIDLYDDDNSSLNNNHIDNNSNIKKLKKKKMEEKNMINHNEYNDSEFNLNEKNIISPSFFINLNTQSPSDEKRNLILMDFLNNKINLYKLKINENNFENINDYDKSFPFQNCRIININNLSYITCGRLNDNNSKLKYNNQLGTKNCYKIIYKKDNKQIKIIKISSTIYEHQSHSLLYLKKYNSIVICSGHQQDKCEYLNLNSDIQNEWKHLFPLRKSRENAISLLFNEKYIFLIGGNDSNGKINEDYDVLNYETFINGKYQSYWKTYSFDNKLLLQQKLSGIIYQNNNIFIFGGFNLDNNFFSWKINFEEVLEDNISVFIKGELDKNYKISSAELCDNINNYINQKNIKNGYVFCGEQVFMNYKNFLVNISFGGELVIIPKYLFK